MTIIEKLVLCIVISSIWRGFTTSLGVIMKQLFYTIFAAIFALSTTQAGAMEMFPVDQPQATQEVSTSDTLKQDAKRLGFWAGCVGLSAITGGLFLSAADAAPRRAVTKEKVQFVLVSGRWNEVPYKDTWYEPTAIHKVLGVLGCGSFGVAGLFGGALVADSARMVSTWLPKALYPWSGLTKVERLKAFGLSAGAAVSAGYVGLALYCGYKSL